MAARRFRKAGKEYAGLNSLKSIGVIFAAAGNKPISERDDVARQIDWRAGSLHAGIGGGTKLDQAGWIAGVG